VTGSYALALSIFSIQTISSSIFEIPTGVFSDFVGRKLTIVYGQICTALAVCAYAVGGTFAILVIGALLEGLARSLFSGNDSALLYETLQQDGKESEYSEWYGKTRSMYQIALGVSAIVGGLALTAVAYQALFWVSVVPQVIAIFLAFFLIEPTRKHSHIDTNVFAHIREAFTQFKTNVRLRKLSIANMLDYGLGEPVHEFFPVLLATLWPPWAVAFARACSHGFGALGFRMAGGIIKKYGELRSMLGVGSMSFTVSTLIIAFPTVLTPAIKSVTSFAFGVGLTAQDSLRQKEFTSEQRATMGSLTSLGGSICFGIGAYLLGLFADSVGIQIAMLTAQVLSVVTLILYWRIYASGNKNTALNK
jgi:MFS family permease